MWSTLSDEHISKLEKRMQKEHPTLQYSRRNSQVETIDKALAGMSSQVLQNALTLANVDVGK